MEISNRLIGEPSNPSMSCAEDSLAKTLASQEMVPGSMGVDQGCGSNTSKPFAYYDQNSSSWKTWQLSLFEGSTELSEPWPRAGMTRNGMAYQRAPLVPPIEETVYGLLPNVKMWPTPRAMEIINGASHLAERSRPSGLTSMVNVEEGLSPQTTGKLNPEFVEWLMGYPIGWTALED